MSTTAKKMRIIREYYEDLKSKNKSYADPFEVEDIEDNFNIDIPEYNFSKKFGFVTTKRSDDENMTDDEILSKNVNFVEAEKLIASLKLNPKRKHPKKSVVNRCEIDQRSVLKDQEEFKKGFEKLNKLRSRSMVERFSFEEEEETDWI